MIYNFKVGDKVFIKSIHRGISVGIVDRVTPTGRVRLKNSADHYRQDGSLIGDMWASEYIVPYTEEEAEKIKIQKTINHAVDLVFNIVPKDINYEQALAIIKIFEGDK